MTRKPDGCTFRATIDRSPLADGSALLAVPVAQALALGGGDAVAVRGTLARVPFRTALTRAAADAFIMVVAPSLLKSTGLAVGDTAEVTLQVDDGARPSSRRRPR